MNNTSTKSKLRYRIRVILGLLTYAQVRSKKRQIIARCEISERTLYRYLNVEKDDTADIPAQHLLIIAEVLEVHISELFNLD